MLVLESLESAQARGAAILCEFMGYGASDDAYHISAPAENGAGAALSMQLALDDAELHAEDIGYINAHGTSTQLNDKSETAAIKKVFGPHAYRVPISSTKSMTGHLLGASGGVHPSFMPQEALKHADAVVIGEVELVIDKLLDDLKQGSMRGTYKSDVLHPMVGVPMPRYDLLKKHRYVNKTFVQTSRGCHQGCTFCAEPLMNGLKFRYRPVDEVINEMENCGARTISINDADFFGTPERPKEVMRALKGRGIQWQAGVTSKLAQDDRMLELAAASGCTLLSIGFESISRDTLKSVHKHVNRPETFAALVEKVHSYGIMVFGLFMFGFDGDDTSVFDETVKFNIAADYDACAYSTLTPYPGTLTWYEMKKANRIVSFDWTMYDQGHVVYRPAQMSGDELRRGQSRAYESFYSTSSIAGRFPLLGKRHRAQWLIYNMFMRRGSQTEKIDSIAAPTAEPDVAPMPPILPVKREWRAAVLEAAGGPGPHLS